MIQKFYHWTLSQFNNFDEKFLWNNIWDLLSFLGFHFTPSFRMAENLFAYSYEVWKQWTVLEIEYDVINKITITETELVKDIIKFWYQELLITKYMYNKLIKLPYIWNWWDNIVSCLYKYGKLNKIDIKQLTKKYKKVLLKLWIDTIEYRNDVEWGDEERYDYILLNTKLIYVIQ